MELKRRVIVAAFETGVELEAAVEALAHAGFEKPHAHEVPNADNQEVNLPPHPDTVAPAPIKAQEPPVIKGSVEPLDGAHADTMRVPEGLAEGGAAGALFGGTIGLLVGVGGMAFPALIPAFATGSIVPAATGIAVGTTIGSIHGALRGWGVNDASIDEYEELIGKGYQLLSVRCVSEVWETKATTILNEQGASSVSIFTEGEAAPLTNRPKVDWVSDTY